MIKKLPVTLCSLLIISTSALASDLTQALHYKLKDANSSRPVSLAMLKGKYKAIFIDMFASWCGPCQGEMTQVVKLHNQLASKGVYFIGLDVWDQWNAMKKDMAKEGLNYSVYHDDAPTGKGIGPLLGVSQLPVVFILDGKTLKPVDRWNNYDPSTESMVRGQQFAKLRQLGVKI